MKHKVILTTVIALTINSQFATAGSITDTYTTGDTLTATTLNNIKDAVNDNDTNVGANTGAIASLFGGDGSAGDLTIIAAVNWSSTPPANPYFANITIEAGQTLTVQSGTTIRCSGNFTNNGTLAVLPNDNAGFHVQSTNELQSATVIPHPGDSISSAGVPESSNVYSSQPTSLTGGAGGVGIPRSKALTSYTHFNYGGGGGTAHQAGGAGFGGGLVKIYCNGSISNFGLINADAPISVQGGGGGGGIVVLASLTEVNNDAAATISANGGNGSGGQTNNGVAGGGGGGIIVLAAPSINNLSTSTTVLGGTAGTAVGTVTSANASGGGGGGASGGNGGAGGTVSNTGTQNAAGNGLDGHIIEITAMPILN